jgi:Uma2 family endonuclease
LVFKKRAADRESKESTVMSTQARVKGPRAVEYPDSDGKPLADNTLQFEWITTLKGGVEDLFRDRADVFVAGDLLWYPVEGNNKIRIAPDVMVALGRPKGYRGSYMQWMEGNIAPQVVFEVLSPGNRPAELERKREFYERYGVREYYQYDPDHNVFRGWVRREEELKELELGKRWESPLLKVRFEFGGEELEVYKPDGRRFATYLELARERDEAARERDEAARERDEAARERDEERVARESAEREAEAARGEIERLHERMRAAGLQTD